MLFWLVTLLCTSLTAQVNLIPQPEEITISSGFFSPDNFQPMSAETYVQSSLNSSLLKELGPEGYRLSVTPATVKLIAATQTGIFYGKQTLRQLATEKGIPCVTIKDKPRFGYRGIHLDVSRHFFPKEEIFKILDELARYKLNTFHFHLTDNGGWRIQIDKYPLLTSLGAFRTQQDWFQWWDKKDRRFLPEGSQNAYGGYFTKKDIREIIAYATERHITVIPEIEFPAHSDAVFIGYPELCCPGIPYASGEFCVGNEQVYTFMEEVLTEVIELFPSKYIHIGGDEARKVAWKNCPKCQALIEKENLGGIEGLQPYMIDRIQDFLTSKGRSMVGWDEILHNNLHPETIVMSYRGQKGAIEAVNRGNYAVMTPGEVLYFDWYQKDPSTDQRAMYGYTPIKKMYSFQPIPSDQATACFNEEIIQAKSVNPDSVQWIQPTNAHRMIGVQGCCWTEYMEDEQRMEEMMFPRLLAISELAWTPSSRINWNAFKTRMNKHIPLLQERGIQTFALSHEIELTAQVNAETKKMTLILDCEKEPVQIRYTLDGSDPTSKSEIYTGAFVVEPPLTVKAAVFEQDARSGPILQKQIGRKEEIRNYYPVMVPDAWKNM